MECCTDYIEIDNLVHRLEDQKACLKITNNIINELYVKKSQEINFYQDQKKLQEKYIEEIKSNIKNICISQELKDYFNKYYQQFCKNNNYLIEFQDSVYDEFENLQIFETLKLSIDTLQDQIKSNYNNHYIKNLRNTYKKIHDDVIDDMNNGNMTI